MDFIGQVALSDVPSLPEGLRSSGRIAYIFMSGSAGDVSTFDPEGGENAVVLQPGGMPTLVPTVERATYTGEEGEFPECSAQLTLREEPVITDPDTGRPGATIGPDTDIDVFTSLQVNKLGGTPAFIQNFEYPEAGGPWHFLLQLGDDIPLADGTYFSPNFGTGKAYVFVSEDGREGRMLWQC